MKEFDCNKCIKKNVCKYIESINKFYEDSLNISKQYTIDHDSDIYIPIINLQLRCLEYKN